MPYAAAAFFFNQSCYVQAFRDFGQTGDFLGFTLKKFKNEEIKVKVDTEGEHPVVVFEIDDVHRRPPAEESRLVQEMFAVRTTYGKAFTLLRKRGRNKLRKSAVHFFIKIGNIARHPPEITSTKSQRTAA